MINPKDMRNARRECMRINWNKKNTVNPNSRKNPMNCHRNSGGYVLMNQPSPLENMRKRNRYKKFRSFC